MTRPPYMIEISKIDFEPTRGEDDRKFEVFARFVALHGRLQHPIVVRQNGDRFVIVEGARRLKALKFLGHTYIPCRIVAGQTAQGALLSLIEQHKQLELDDFTFAEALERAFFIYNIGLTEIAMWAGMNERDLQAAYALLMRASPALRKAIHDGWVLPNRAVQIALLTGQRQHQVLNTIKNGSQEDSDGTKGDRRLLRCGADGHRGAARKESSRQRATQEARGTSL